MTLTRQEQAAIRMLRRLAARWPQTLWLYAAPEALNIMRRGPGRGA